MTDLLKGAVEQYRQKLQDETRVIEVAEFPQADGSPLRIYVKPTNLYQRDIIAKMYDRSSNISIAVDTILLRSLDEHGQKLFSDNYRDTMLKAVDADVLLRVAAEINHDLVELAEKYNQEDEFEEAVKN